LRYADDFSIYAKSKVETKQLGNEVYIFLKEKLDLPINRAKSGIRRPSTFELLGYGFVPNYKKGEKGIYQLVVKQGSWQNLKRKLKAITKKTLPYQFNERLQKLKQVWQGWVNYYRTASIYTILKMRDEMALFEPKSLAL
jgi:hypothetical protein